MNSVERSYIYDKKRMVEFEIEQVISNERDYTFVCGDLLEILKTIPDETINCVVTTPPYWNLREHDVACVSNGIINKEDYTLFI